MKASCLACVVRGSLGRGGRGRRAVAGKVGMGVLSHAMC